MSSELLQYRYDVLASLYWIPCTLQELAKGIFVRTCQLGILTKYY